MALFTKCGAMDAVTSYLPRPYAFVYFRTIEDAKAAKETLQGILIRGNNIRIEFARPAKPGKTLWVGGISQSVKENQLEDIFMKFGKIEEYKFLRHRGSAFITFYRIDDAIAAQRSMNWKHLGGSEIRVDFQKSPYQRRDWAGERQFRGNTDFLQNDQLLSPDEIKYFHDSPHHGLNTHPVTFEKPYGERRDGQPSNVLWVGYPPELQIDEELLHNSMILFGEIERIQSFPSRHYCYVEFRSVDEARRAKEGLQGRLLGDSRIQILFTNSDQVPGWENFSLTGQEIFVSDPPIGTAELFFPGHSIGPSHFPGNLAPNAMPRANVLVRPFTPGFDPLHSGSDFHEFGGGIHGFPDGVFNNPLATNWKKPSLSAPGIINSGPRMRPPLRPSQGGWDEFDTREPKRSRFDGFSSSDVHFQGGIVDAADISDFPGLSRSDKILLNHRIQTPDMQIHQPSSAIPAIDYCWRGIIAKGGTPVCHARCLPIENGIESPFPDIVNCSARTGLDMLTAHYAEAIGFDMVYFLPDSEEDFASYTEFLRYLGQRDRAGVAKFDDGTTMFLVPPSDFLTKVLKFSGPERLYGVVLKLPHQSTTLGHQLQAMVHPSDPIDRQQGFASQRNYGLIAQNEHQSLNIDYGSSSHERSVPNARPERPRSVHSEDPNSMTLIAQDHSKRYETTRPDVSITPELIATLASLIPTSTQPSAPFSSQMSSTSSRMPTSFSGPPLRDNSMLTMQRWGQEARTTISGSSVEQLYNPMQNLPPPGHPSEAPMVPHFPTYTNTTSGLDNSFQPTLVGMPIQEASIHMQQAPPIIGTVGNAVSSQAGQFQVLPNIQSNDVASFYNLPIRQQITPATHTTGHNGNVLQILADTPVISDKLNTVFPRQAQPLLAAISSSGQGTSEGDADKDQRYQSTLQFAASLLLQIQQQQQAKAQAGLGSENQL